MILLDTDVLIDRIERGVEPASLAWHSISNLYYIVKPTRGDITTRDFIRELTEFVQVAETDTESIRYAIRIPMTDFEDAMQVAAAQACNAQFIVTRNTRDYQRSPIPAITPQQHLTS